MAGTTAHVVVWWQYTLEQIRLYFTQWREVGSTANLQICLALDIRRLPNCNEKPMPHRLASAVGNVSWTPSASGSRRTLPTYGGRRDNRASLWLLERANWISCRCVHSGSQVGNMSRPTFFSFLSPCIGKGAAKMGTTICPSGTARARRSINLWHI